MTMTTPRPASSKLLDELAARNSSLWNDRRSESWQGTYISEADAPNDLDLLTVWMRIPLDLLLVVLRPIGLVIVWPLWWIERTLAAWTGITFFCPTCHHSTRDPYVYCPQCGRVQGRLRPTIVTVFGWRCAACGKTTWPVLGNFLFRSPKHLICRNTARSFGCYRPIPVEINGRPVISRHVVVASPGFRAKHAFLAHFVHHAIAMLTPPIAAQCIPWELNRREIEILRNQLCHSYSTDTSTCEQRADGYTLARTLIIKRSRRRSLVLHNLARRWVRTDAELYTRGPNWRTTYGLIFVIDLDEVEQNRAKVELTHIEVLERLIRTIQQRIPLEPNIPLPMKVAVAIPLGPTASAKPFTTKARQLSAKAAEEIVRQVVPSLYAVLRLCARRQNVRFFSGDMPDDLLLERTHWVRELLRWVA